MIYFDVTKMHGARQKSGLTRVSSRLLAEFGAAVVPVAWRHAKFETIEAKPRAVAFAPEDWLLTVELFSGAERPGFREFVARPPCRLAAVFPDAIPLTHPHITWPHSVQRHPDYMKLLAGFDRVWGISEAVQRDLVGFWQWQGVPVRARVDAVELGSDFDGSVRATSAPPSPTRGSFVCVGIIEPRKNQMFLLDVAEALWRTGADFDLHIVGRVNPHFGEPIVKRIKALAKAERRLRLHVAAGDETLRSLYANASAVVFPTIAEGCGLPVIEALWRGVPCVCSDLPVLRENADHGGCVVAKTNDLTDWTAKLRSVLDDAALQRRLRTEAVSRPLPTWRQTADALLSGLRR
jgi:glycosyltransferase involved in cell wall biosynthesis